MDDVPAMAPSDPLPYRFADRRLGKAISQAERAHDSGAVLNEPLWTTLPDTTQIVGITGPPGAGKSTLTDKLVAIARSLRMRVGVLAIDPSSPFTGGAILGDRIRMSAHTTDAGVFIRSMGSRTQRGGLAAATRSAARILAEQGTDIIILETVGVGQAELDIMHVADTVVVVMVPGLGDTVQMNKAGIIEIGDVFAINQADRPEAPRTRRDLEQALMLGHRGGTMPSVTLTRGTDGSGVEDLWDNVRRHYREMLASGQFTARRQDGQRREIAERVGKLITRDLDHWIESENFAALLAVHHRSVDEIANEAAQAYMRQTALNHFRDY